jgi:hypothetical protein
MQVMLIPQFSIRWLLALMTVCAVVFSIVGLAARGHAWAAGVSVGIGALVVLAFVYGSLFAVVWTFSVVTAPLRGGGAGSETSPFAADAAEKGRPFDRREAPAVPILLDSSPEGS